MLPDSAAATHVSEARVGGQSREFDSAASLKMATTKHSRTSLAPNEKYREAAVTSQSIGWRHPIYGKAPIQRSIHGRSDSAVTKTFSDMNLTNFDKVLR